MGGERGSVQLYASGTWKNRVEMKQNKSCQGNITFSVIYRGFLSQPQIIPGHAPVCQGPSYNAMLLNATFGVQNKAWLDGKAALQPLQAAC